MIGRLAAAAAALALAASATAAPAPAKVSPPVHKPAAVKAGEGDIALGAANAPVTVIEYASVTCPHCAAWDREVFPAFKAKYVDTGKVRYILREFATDPEEWSEAGFLVARCAGPTKFFNVVEALMGNQQTLYGGPNGGPAWLFKGGAVGGLGQDQVKACLHDDKQVKALQARLEANDKAFHVDGTPTFFVNGEAVGDGEVTLAELDKAIAQAGLKPPSLRGAQKPGAKPAAKPAAAPAHKAKAG